jgi:hypothetical protein
MKVKSLIAGAAAAIIVPVAGFATPVLASSPGQIDGGDIYRVKNVTQNGAYAASATAGTCQEVQYKVLLHNSGYGSVSNVTAKATLPSGGGTSTMTVTYDSNGPSNGVSGTASLSLTGGAKSVSYEAGSTELQDGNGKLIKALPDGITSGGVNTGTLNGSTAELVTFKAKTDCPTPPETCKTNPKLCPPVTPPTTPPTTTTTTTSSTPTTLVNTGPGETAALFAIAMAAGTLGYRKFLSRRLSNQ